MTRAEIFGDSPPPPEAMLRLARHSQDPLLDDPIPVMPITQEIPQDSGLGFRTAQAPGLAGGCVGSATYRIEFDPCWTSEASFYSILLCETRPRHCRLQSSQAVADIAPSLDPPNRTALVDLDPNARSCSVSRPSIPPMHTGPTLLASSTSRRSACGALGPSPPQASSRCARSASASAVVHSARVKSTALFLAPRAPFPSLFFPRPHQPFLPHAFFAAQLSREGRTEILNSEYKLCSAEGNCAEWFAAGCDPRAGDCLATATGAAP